MASWQFQIKQFCKKDFLKVELYLGPDRNQLLTRVKRKNDVDIVITSYETLMSEWANYNDYIDEIEEEKAEKKMFAAAAAKKKSRTTSSKSKNDAWHDNDNDSEEDWDPESETESDDDDDHYLPPSILKSRKRPAASKKPSTWIFELEFHRVVLDEGNKFSSFFWFYWFVLVHVASSYRISLFFFILRVIVAQHIRFGIVKLSTSKVVRQLFQPAGYVLPVLRLSTR